VHRGPDDSGLFLDQNVGLGHRRLSIVDVAAGHQPMTNEDGTLHITYNGEIYNHTDFRAELEAAVTSIKRVATLKPFCTSTRSTANAASNVYAACLPSLSGTRTKENCSLRAIRLGVKPLYYALNADGSLYFASEIKAILVAGAVDPELNYAALPDYLANHATSGEDTLFAGVKRLLPGHTLLWRDGRIAIRKYWDISFSDSSSNHRTDKDYVAEWLDLFRTSVRLRLMADVPLGMFLVGRHRFFGHRGAHEHDGRRAHQDILGSVCGTRSKRVGVRQTSSEEVQYRSPLRSW
jgi:asparagine synthase (glutamine-hydrolysing)